MQQKQHPLQHIFFLHLWYFFLCNKSNTLIAKTPANLDLRFPIITFFLSFCRMESTGQPGRVHISEKTYQFLTEDYYVQQADDYNGKSALIPINPCHPGPVEGVNEETHRVFAVVLFGSNTPLLSALPPPPPQLSRSAWIAAFASSPSFFSL